MTLWSRITKNSDWSTGLVRSLVLLARSLAPHYSLRSRAPLLSLICALARSLTPELVGQ